MSCYVQDIILENHSWKHHLSNHLYVHINKYKLV